MRASQSSFMLLRTAKKKYNHKNEGFRTTKHTKKLLRKEQKMKVIKTFQHRERKCVGAMPLLLLCGSFS